MISNEAIDLLNKLLKDIPEDKDFRVSTYLKIDSTNLPISESDIKEKEGRLSWEIHSFLIAEGFAERTGSAILLRKGTTPDMVLTPDKGVSLKRAGSFEKYYADENADSRKEDNQIRQYTITDKLTGIIALWTFIAGVYYIMQIMDYIIPGCICYHRIIVTTITLVSLLLGWYLLRPLLLKLLPNRKK